MADSQLNIRLTVQDDGSVAIDKVSSRLRHLEADGTRAAERLGAAWARLGPVLAGALSVGAVVSFGRAAVAAAEAQERAERRLESVLRATGHAAGYTGAQLSAMAGELQAATNFSDDAILELQSVLATFKEIRGSEFRAATEAALDLATILGTDLKSAALQLGKALQDPAQGLSALTRAGITFTEAQKRQIEALVEGGRVAEAQRLILAELSGQLGGAARREVLGYEGAVNQLRNSWGDLLKEFGRLVTESPAVEQGFRDARAEVDAWSTSLRRARVALVEYQLDAARMRYAEVTAEKNQPGFWGGLERRLGYGGTSEAELGAQQARYGARIDQLEAELDRLLGRGGAAAPAAPPRADLGKGGKAAGGLGADLARQLAREEEQQRREHQRAVEAAAELEYDLRRQLAREEEALRQEGLRQAEAAEASRGGILRAGIAQRMEAERAAAASLRGIEAERLRQSVEAERAAAASKAGLERARLGAAIESGRNAELAQRNVWATGLATAQQMAGSYAGLMRQLYEDSGGQADGFWKAYKAFAIAETLVSTAVTIMNLWRSFTAPPPLGLGPAGIPLAQGFSAMVGALGAAQVALIARQQPAKAFAAGGVVTRPMQGLVGEAGPEAIIPLHRLPQIIRESTTRETRGPVTVHVNVPLQGDVSPETEARIRGAVLSAVPQAMAWALRDHGAVRAGVRHVARG